MGSRQAAGRLLAAPGQQFRGAVVTVDASELRTGTPSFADAMVLGILVEGGAKELRLRNAPADFAQLVMEAAGRRLVADRVSVEAS